jgi:hypothetical protein
MKINHNKMFLLLFLVLPFFAAAQSRKTGEYYQVTVYHFSNADQQTLIDGYLKEAYLPALHRQKIKSVGVFTPISNDTATDKRLYVIIPLRSLQDAADLTTRLGKDNDYLANGKAYVDAAFKTPAFTRKENILLKAFPLAPSMVLPRLQGPLAERVYELRSYESASEKIFANKVKMFNEGGEISLFKRLNFNAVFYASVIAGSRVPNLMYMTSFENMADRDTHWKTFSADPEWKKTSGMPEYQNNVQKIDIILMRATPYSDY